MRSRYHKARPVPENWAYYILCRTWRSGDAEQLSASLCKGFHRGNSERSRLPCVRGAVTAKRIKAVTERIL